MDPLVLNFLYAVLGGFVTLGFMWLGCKLFSLMGDLDIIHRGIKAVHATYDDFFRKSKGRGR